MANESFIKARNLVKKYGSTTILEDISFDINRSEVLVLCGPSGCGKSTLLRCLNGLETIQGGQIWIDNVELRGASQKELRALRQRVGMVFQMFNLFPHMTTLKNIIIAPMKLLNKTKQQATEDAMRLLEIVGIPEKVDEYPCALSGGQRQRVAIARALAMKPDLMLFDEPTSALDPEMKEEVLNVIERLRTEEKMTMVLVTHEINFVKNVADRVMMIEDREIVEESSAKTFFENPKEERTKIFLKAITDL
ncbi:MAG: amino acid ABC transporter ATP-binding protein [Deltaproteobacteria bacterium]|jgi:ABC-type polar amino acid transport system ATPase subunit|nr:amino acid ABC transporter ATP-binding protein [Deltaproteobacteria bacterium]